MLQTLRRTSGFTLMEVVVVVGMIGILMAIASPLLKDWVVNARYKGTTRKLASAMRDARARTISANLEHRVEVDLDADRFRITRGNRPYNSTASAFDEDENLVLDWVDAAAGIDLRANAACDVTSGEVTIGFNPNGSSESQYVCIVDEEGVSKYRTGVNSPSTGRVVVQQFVGPDADDFQ